MEQRDERSFLRRVLDFPVEDVLGVAALLAAFAVMSVQIFLRYVLNDSLIWSEEAARYLLIAMDTKRSEHAVEKRLIDMLVRLGITHLNDNQ